MNAEHYNRLSGILAEVCELSEPHRSERIDALCNGDADLAEEVHGLLALDDGDSEPGVAGAIDECAAPIPEQVGSYRVIRLIGVGGMGAVYEAEQRSPRRRIALKLLRFSAATPGTLRRFKREADALARLQHPAIVRIYESGEAETGRGVEPYLAMELVSGRPIDDFVREAGLDQAARLALFIRVCRGVEAAHAVGVIHRDIKPANILIDAEGSPRILDFGVARITSGETVHQTVVTQQGAVVGSIGYMSPEQIESDLDSIDARSDVYSLGVLLFELLSERSPIDLAGASLPEALRRLRDATPLSLSTIDARYRGDLNTIVSKALSREPDHRYQSVSALRADVERHLGDEPITARAPSTLYVISKLARRHRALAASLGAIFLILLVGIGATSLALIRALDAEARLEGRLERERAEREKAEAAIEFVVDDVLGSIDPMKDGDRTITMRDAVDRARANVELRFGRQPLAEALVRLTLSDVDESYGDYESSLHEAQLALARLDETDDPVLRADAQRAVGVAHTHMNNYEPAETSFRKAVAVADAALGPDDPLTLSARSDLAWFHERANDYEQAQRINRDVLERRRRVLGPEHPDTLTSLNNIAKVDELAGRYEDAVRTHRQVLEVRERVLGEHHPNTLASLNGLGLALTYLGELEEAERVTLENQRRLVRVFGEDHYRVLWIRNNLGLIYLNQHDDDRAATLFEQLNKDALRLLGEDHNWTLVPEVHLIQALLGVGDDQGAMEVSEDSIVRARRLLGVDRWQYAVHLLYHAACIARVDGVDAAEPVAVDAVSLFSRTLGDEHPRTTRAIADIETAWREIAGDAAAEDWLRRWRTPPAPGATVAPTEGG